MIKKRRSDDSRANALTIPMSAEEKEEIRTAADKMGLTMSSYARLVLKEKLNESK